MKRYKIFNLATLLCITMIFGGCSEEWLDVNEDPNNAATATPELVFPAGVASGASVVGGYYNLLGGFWSQYWAQSNSANQYKYMDQYQIQSSDFNTQWQEMYGGCLSDLQYTIVEAHEAENYSLEFMATVMQVYFWQVMVDLYNEIPYFDAFKGISENLFSPTYDDPALIYDDFIIRIDSTMAHEFNSLTPAQQNADQVFGGDMDAWVAFANTLKLKIYIRQMYVRPEVAEAGIKSLYNSGATFLDQDAFLDIFIDQENYDNFLYASDRRKLNVATNLRVSTTLFRYFEQNNDPRLSDIVQEDGGTVPMPQGGYNIPSTELDPTTVAVYKLEPDDPVYFISEVESYLLQAEAIALGWGTGDAEALYDLAIVTDFERRGFSTEEFEDLIGDGNVYDYPEAGTFEEKQEAIIMAKWAAMSGSQGIEAFFERNRTGYPNESTVPAWSNGSFNDSYVGGRFTYSLEGVTSGEFPTRLIYPQDEVTLNTEFPGQTEVTDRVWWDTKGI